MRQVYLIIITVFVSFVYLFLTDSSIGINGDFLAASKENAIEKKLLTDLANLKQKVILPVENRNSYILNEQKIDSYKNSSQSTVNTSTKSVTSSNKGKVTKSSRSKWKR